MKKNNTAKKSDVKFVRFDYPDNSDIWFELPEKWTVRHVLNYDSVIETSAPGKQGLYLRTWDALRRIADPEKWHCESVPLDMNLDEVGDTEILDIIKWAGLKGFSVRRSLEPDSKN